MSDKHSFDIYMRLYSTVVEHHTQLLADSLALTRHLPHVSNFSKKRDVLGNANLAIYNALMSLSEARDLMYKVLSMPE